VAKALNGRAHGNAQGRPASGRAARKSGNLSGNSRSITQKNMTARTAAHPLKGKQRPLRDMTEEALGRYFRDLNGHRPGDLYDLVLGEVEEPLFRAVMEYTRGNQSLAAEVLGINRATLRKKLRHYQILD
jgi:Fis family transcriptional regulator